MLRRVASAFGLAISLAGLPVVLRVAAGSPSVARLPSWGWLRGGLRDQYLPVDPLLHALGLVAWSLWGYAVLVVALRLVAVIAARAGIAGSAALLALSNLVTLAPVRGLVDATIGVSLLASTAHAAPTSTTIAATPAAVVRTVDASQAPGGWDRARPLLEAARVADISHAPALARLDVPMDDHESPVVARPDPVTPTSPPGGAHRRTYTVQDGDSLWRIAERELRDPLRWREIYALNQGSDMGDGRVFRRAGLILPGWVLYLPAEEQPAPATPPSPPADGEHQGPSTSTPPAEASATTPPSTTAPTTTVTTAGTQAPTPDGPEPAPPAQVPDTHHPEQAPATTAPSLTSLPAPRGDSRPQPPSHPAGPARPAVELPSGAVVGLSLAGGIAVALAAARLHQRRRRRLGEPRPGITHADPLVTPTVQRLRHAARASNQPDAVGYAPDRSLDRDPDLDRAEDADATIRRAAPAATAPTPLGPEVSMRPGVVAIGQRDGQEVTVDLTDGGLGLDGPTAPEAARAVIVALLATQPQADAVELLVVGERLVAQLLGDAVAIPGLRVVASLDTALSTVEVEMIHRLRLLQGHETTDVASYLEVDPAEPLPTIVLVTDPTHDTEGWAQRLAAVLAMGQRLGIGALLLGPIQGVATLTLGPNAEIQAVQHETEGALPGLVGGRAFTLGQAEAAELLAVVAAGRGTHPAVSPEQSPPRSPELLGLPAVPAPQAQVETAPDSRAAPDERPIRVRLFGPPRIELDDTEVRTGLRTKSKELLAFLLLHPDGVRRETATETLWPDMDPARSAARAKDALRSLRQALQTATGQAGATVVELTGDRLRVNPALVDCDTWRFQAALATVATATDDQVKLQALTQASAAYGGTLLEGADYDWAEAAREELRRQAADVAGRLAELREQAGDLDGAIAALEDGARWDTYNEELHQRIMRLQARLGRLDAVRRTYTRLQERLADLGADPDEATERLLHELRRSSTTRR